MPDNQEILNLVLFLQQDAILNVLIVLKVKNIIKTINKETISQLITFINSHEKDNKLSLNMVWRRAFVSITSNARDSFFKSKKSVHKKSSIKGLPQTDT